MRFHLTQEGRTRVGGTRAASAEAYLQQMAARGWTLVKTEPTPAERIERIEAQHAALVEELVARGTLPAERAEALKHGPAPAAADEPK